jgi:hypothetical protein
VTFNVKSFAGVQFEYPADFLPCIAAASGFDLGPGESTIVKARWPADLVPPPGTHACWLAAVLTRSDHPVAGRRVWEHNNLAQKNLTIVNLKPGGWLVLPFVLATFKARVVREFQLELVRSAGAEIAEAHLLHASKEVFRAVPNLQPVDDLLPAEDRIEPAGELDCGGRERIEVDWVDVPWTSQGPPARAALRFARAYAAPFAAGRRARIPVRLRRQEQLVMGLRVKVPADSQEGDVIHLELVKRDRKGRKVLGGLTIEIRVIGD